MNKKISVHFEKDDSLEGIDIVIRASEEDDRVKELLNSFAEPSKRMLNVTDGLKSVCQIEEKDIISVSAEGKNVRIITGHGIYYAKKPLKTIEQNLAGSVFFRISRFEIINLKKVKKYDFTIGGMLRVVFDNGTETWASRRYIPLIKSRLMKEDGLS